MTGFNLAILIFLRNSIVEGRTVSNQHRFICFFSLKLSNGSLIDLVNKQVVLDATHAHSELNQLAYEKRQGA